MGCGWTLRRISHSVHVNSSLLSVCFHNSLFSFFFSPHFPHDLAPVADKYPPAPIIHASIHHPSILIIHVISHWKSSRPSAYCLLSVPQHIYLTNVFSYYSGTVVFSNNAVITHPNHLSLEEGGQHTQDIISKAEDIFPLVNVQRDIKIVNIIYNICYFG